MKLKDCKNILKVGMKVREVRNVPREGEYNCSELRDGNYAEITKIDKSGVWFNGCFHAWNSDIDLDLTPSWDNLFVGMTLIDESGRECEILEVGASGKTVLLSFPSNYPNHRMRANRDFHIEELQFAGYKIKDAQEPEITELTTAEVEKKLGIKAGTLRIRG